MTKRLFQVAIAVSVVISIIAVCWLAFNLAGYIVASAFNSAPAQGIAWVALWFGWAGLAVTVTWEMIAKYRRAFRIGDNKRGSVANSIR